MKKYEQYTNIVAKTIEEYDSNDESLISYLASSLEYEKIDIEDFVKWVKKNHCVIEALHNNSKKFKMLKIWEELDKIQSLSIEELF